ncbi:MAG TPA: universal stress protein [Desulfobacteraceae bacterium]|nr:universal stress protein [Desulfobacteraceae bacterium]
MFEKILYPTDFSDVSKKALAYIKNLRNTGTKQVIILRVINKSKAERISQGVAWAGVEVADFLKETYQKLGEEAYEEVKPIESELKETGFEVKIRVVKGIPYSKILEVEQEEDVSAIVLGSHGRSNLSDMLLGSVSNHVIRHSKKPVLVIKRE